MDWPQQQQQTSNGYANFPPPAGYGMHYQGQTSSLPSPHYFPQFSARPQFSGDFGGGVPQNAHYGRPAPAPGRQDFNGGGFRGGGRGGFARGGGRGGHGMHMSMHDGGDWLCPNCSVNCFASRNECFRCSTPRPHGGGGGRGYGGRGGLGGGGFSGPFSGGPPRREGDWFCPTCSANVFGTRFARSFRVSKKDLNRHICIHTHKYAKLLALGGILPSHLLKLDCTLQERVTLATA
jgi:hypothetical protein